MLLPEHAVAARQPRVIGSSVNVGTRRGTSARYMFGIRSMVIFGMILRGIYQVLPQNGLRMAL